MNDTQNAFERINLQKCFHHRGKTKGFGCNDFLLLLLLYTNGSKHPRKRFDKKQK
uniref:hypothetical protein n=1 Tax=Photobacterium carnosum TaxID=2023717 RepID=UPI001883E12D|nr:hypothetical protein [Photobacterium carnosum]